MLTMKNGIANINFTENDIKDKVAAGNFSSISEKQLSYGLS